MRRYADQRPTLTDADELPHSSSDDEALLTELSQEVERLTAALEGAEADRAEVDQLRNQLTRTTENLRRLQSRKVVRAGLALAERTIGLQRALGGVRRWLRRRRATTAWRRAQRTLRRRRRFEPSTRSTATVTIVIPTRDGATKLAELLPALRDTSYRNFDVTIVDNASTDDTNAVLGEYDDLPIRVIRNDHNASFSDACNQGIESSTSDYVLFLNNDVIPLNPSWLGHMLAASAENVGAVGALLVYPEADVDTRTVPVQHYGIAFGWKDGAPRARNIAPNDALDPSLLDTQPVPAVTAACMLVSRTALDEVGGFTSGYLYGWEDVDLCLKLERAGKRSVVCGQAALVHEEFGTQQLLGADVRASNYRNNAALFARTWLPELGRRLRVDGILGDGFWNLAGPRSAAIAVSSVDATDGYGDLYTALELAKAMRALGWTVDLVGRDPNAWSGLTADYQVVIALLPDFDPAVAHGALTVAWVRNWVDRWVDRPSFRSFDLVACASQAFADDIRLRTGKDTFLLPLATNPDRFTPGQSVVDFETDLAFVGSAWGRAGRAFLDLLDLDGNERLAIYGKNWDRFGWGVGHWRGHLDYDRVVDVYRSADLIIDDTAEANRPALNSRVFDAAATGAVVISDNVTGSAEWFDGDLPTFSSRTELRSVIDRYRHDIELRRATGAKLRAHVLAHHTYPIRATTLIEAIEAHVRTPGAAVRISTPSDDVAEQWGDTHFGRALCAALSAEAFAPRLSLLGEWDGAPHQLADVSIHLRGRNPYIPKPNQINVLWIISHPDDVSVRECERFDIVFTASARLTEKLRSKTDVPVHTLLQATDETVFAPIPEVDRVCDAVFVGNTRGQDRPIVRWAIEAGLDVHVYGAGWDDVLDGSTWKAVEVPNRQVPELYRSARVVLNDHWPDMAEEGIISNRVFDALACGTPVISDHVAGLADLSPHVGIARSSDDVARLATTLSPMDADVASKFSRTHSFGARAAELATQIRSLHTR